MRDFKYAIFDMDGTILDSMFQWRHMVAIHVFEMLSGIKLPDDVIRDAVQYTYYDCFDFLQKKYGTNFSNEVIKYDYRKYEEVMIPHYEAEICPKPYAREYLEMLYNKDIKMCILTATSEYIATAVLKRYDLLKYFDFVLSTKTFGKEKHFPDVFLYAMEKLGANADNAVVFDDSLYCIKTAKSAGLYVAAVEDPTSSEVKDDILELCDVYIDDYSKLIH